MRDTTRFCTLLAAAFVAPCLLALTPAIANEPLVSRSAKALEALCISTGLDPVNLDVQVQFFKHRELPRYAVRKMSLSNETGYAVIVDHAPVTVTGQIAAHRVAALVPIIRQVLQDAIQAGGSSLKDFRQASGELGYFQHSFDAYGREGEACRREGCAGSIARITQSGRSTFYCVKCQR